MWKFVAKNTKFFTKAAPKKKESGSMLIDEIGSLLVLVFMIAMILAYAGYSKSVQTRLSIDSIAKKYLYQMEAQGYLSTNMQADMTNDMAGIGVTIENFSGTSHTAVQAGYGDKITLGCTLSFDNPLYSFFTVEKGGLFSAIIEDTIEYSINMSSTAKW